jgi:uncharacterized membrane protein
MNKHSYIIIAAILFMQLNSPSVQAQVGPDLALDTNFYVIPENVIAPSKWFNPLQFAVNVENIGDETANDITVSCSIFSELFGNDELIYYVEKS